jgi:hypothetical protein
MIAIPGGDNTDLIVGKDGAHGDPGTGLGWHAESKHQGKQYGNNKAFHGAFLYRIVAANLSL